MEIEEKNIMDHRTVAWHDVRIKTNSKPQFNGRREVIISCDSETNRRAFLKGFKELLKKHTIEGFELITRLNSANED